MNEQPALAKIPIPKPGHTKSKVAAQRQPTNEKGRHGKASRVEPIGTMNQSVGDIRTSDKRSNGQTAPVHKSSQSKRKVAPATAVPGHLVQSNTIAKAVSLTISTNANPQAGTQKRPSNGSEATETYWMPGSYMSSKDAQIRLVSDHAAHETARLPRSQFPTSKAAVLDHTTVSKSSPEASLQRVLLEAIDSLPARISAFRSPQHTSCEGCHKRLVIGDIWVANQCGGVSQL
jgi:hypothetical protein